MKINNLTILAKGFTPDVGGVESYSEFLMKGYISNKLDVTVVTFGNDVGEKNIFRMKKSNDIFNFLKLLKLLLKDDECEVFHATTWRMALPFLFKKGELIITLHGNEFLKKSFLLSLLMNLVFKRANKLIAVSKYTQERFLDAFRTKSFQKKIFVASNAPTPVIAGEELSSEEIANFMEEMSITNKDLIYYSICRQEKRKNIRSAIIAFNTADIGNSCKYLIAGSGPESAGISALIKELNNPNIIYLGRVSDLVIKLLHKIGHVFLHPQIELDNRRDVEGFGLVIIDAMANCSATISGKDGGPSSFIIDGINGLLLDGNKVNAITDAIEQLANEKIRKELIKKGELTAKSLTWEKHAKVCMEKVDTCKIH
ncbi:MAG: glycosyltransferase involved in cell wall biosynthesis [Francisellaceae bacterium]